MKKKLKTEKSPRLIEESITVFGMKAMRIYANEVNLNRAVPDLLDGNKPVQRRILWAGSAMPKGQLVKTARLVGDVMGKYHPHGDSSISGAIETMIHAPVPLLLGEGNWGNMIDPAAAMRYTLCRLSNFGALAFQSDYINKEVTTFVPNYDDKDIEPVSINYPLPIILMNGGEGIGYGTACVLPTFTPESLVDIIKQLLVGQKLKPADFAKTLKPNHTWGGTPVASKENRQAWLEMFTGSQTSVQYEATLAVDQEKRQLIINEWPPGLNPNKYIAYVRSLPETQSADPTKGALEFTITMKKGYNAVQFDAWQKKLQLKTRVKCSYNVNVTRRTASIVDGVVDYDVALMRLSVPQVLIAWLRARIETEVKALTARVAKQQEAIAYSKLLIYVADHIDLVIKIVRNSSDAKSELVKKLKITEIQAEQILDLQLRRLTKLNQGEIKTKLGEQLAHLGLLNKWLAKPKKKVAADVDAALEAIQADRAYKSKIKTQKLTMV